MDGIDMRHRDEDILARREARRANKEQRRLAREERRMDRRFAEEAMDMGDGTVSMDTVDAALKSAMRHPTLSGSADIAYLKAVVECPRGDEDVRIAIGKVADGLEEFRDGNQGLLPGIARAAAIRDVGNLCAEAKAGYGASGEPAEAALDAMARMGIMDRLHEYAEEGIGLSTMAATYTTARSGGCGFDVACIAAAHGEVNMTTFEAALRHVVDNPSAFPYVDTAAEKGPEPAAMAGAVSNEMAGGNLLLPADVEEDWYTDLEDTLGIIERRMDDARSVGFEGDVARAEEHAAQGSEPVIAFTTTELAEYDLQRLLDGMDGPRREHLVRAMARLPEMTDDELDGIADGRFHDAGLEGRDDHGDDGLGF